MPRSCGAWRGSRTLRVTVDTAGLSPAKTELANLLAERIRALPEPQVEEAFAVLKPAGRRKSS